MILMIAIASQLNNNYFLTTNKLSIKAHPLSNYKFTRRSKAEAKADFKLFKAGLLTISN